MEDQIHINLNSNVFQLNFNSKNNILYNETNWMLMKHMIVNELFGMMRLNFGFGIKNVNLNLIFSTVMTSRGVENSVIANTSMSEKIIWFLEELSQIKPEPSMIALYLSLYPEINKQYFLSYLIWTTANIIDNFPDLKYVKNSEGYSEAFIVTRVINAIAQNTTVMADEFEQFLQYHMPLIIGYIINATSKRDLDLKILDIKAIIEANSKRADYIDPGKIFTGDTSVTENPQKKESVTMGVEKHNKKTEEDKGSTVRNNIHEKNKGDSDNLDHSVPNKPVSKGKDIVNGNKKGNEHEEL